MKLVYIAGKYSGLNFNKVELNIRKARNTALQLIKEVGNKGYFPVTPHMNTSHFEEWEGIFKGIDYEYWLQGCHELLKNCDILLLLDNWEDSNGAKEEKKIAEANGMPIFYSIDELKTYVNKNNRRDK